MWPKWNLELFYRYFFCHIGSYVFERGWAVEVTSKKDRLTPIQVQLSHMPLHGFKPGHWWESVSIQWQYLWPLGQKGRPYVTYYLIIWFIFITKELYMQWFSTAHSSILQCHLSVKDDLLNLAWEAFISYYMYVHAASLLLQGTSQLTFHSTISSTWLIDRSGRFPVTGVSRFHQVYTDTVL